MPFDYRSAVAEGYTDDEIRDYLKQTRPTFDFQGAESEGYTVEEISDYIGSVKPPEPQRKLPEIGVDPSRYGGVSETLTFDQPTEVKPAGFGLATPFKALSQSVGTTGGALTQFAASETAVPIQGGTLEMDPDQQATYERGKALIGAKRKPRSSQEYADITYYRQKQNAIESEQKRKELYADMQKYATALSEPDPQTQKEIEDARYWLKQPAAALPQNWPKTVTAAATVAGESAVQNLISIAGSVGGKIPVVGPALQTGAVITMVGQEQGSWIKEAKELGIDDPELLGTYGRAYGILAGLVEQGGGEILAAPLNAGIAKLGAKQAGKKAAKETAKKALVAKLMPKVIKGLTGVAIGAIGESGEEYGQDYASDVFKWLAFTHAADKHPEKAAQYIKARDEIALGPLTKKRLEAAYYGGVAGAFTMGATKAAGAGISAAAGKAPQEGGQSQFPAKRAGENRKEYLERVGIPWKSRAEDPRTEAAYKAFEELPEEAPAKPSMELMEGIPEDEDVGKQLEKAVPGAEFRGIQQGVRVQKEGKTTEAKPQLLFQLTNPDGSAGTSVAVDLGASAEDLQKKVAEQDINHIGKHLAAQAGVEYVGTKPVISQAAGAGYATEQHLEMKIGEKKFTVPPTATIEDIDRWKELYKQPEVKKVEQKEEEKPSTRNEVAAAYQEAQAREADYERKEKLIQATKGLLNSLDAQSFAGASDRALVGENKRWFAAKGGKGIDEARSDFVARNREAIGELGYNEEDLSTPQGFLDFLGAVPTEKQLETEKEAIDNTYAAIEERPPETDEEGFPVGPDGQPMFSREKAPAFYSPTLKAVESLKQEKGTGDQFLAMIQKSPGVKKAETDWMDLEGFLKGKKSATKQEIAEFVWGNQVEIQEVKKGERSGRFTIRNTAGEEEVFSTREAALGRIRQEEEWVENEAIQISKDGLSAYDFDSNEVISFTENDDGLYEADRYPEGVSIEDAKEIVQEEVKSQKKAMLGELTSSSRVEKEEGDTKYSQYTLPGGENYREVLLTMPPAANENVSGWEVERDDGSVDFYETREAAYEEAGREIGSTVTSATSERPEKERTYTSSHWDEPNVFAHVRLNDRTGPSGERVLFIEEIQSDWEREARDKGIREPGMKELSLEEWGKQYEGVSVADVEEEYRKKNMQMQMGEIPREALEAIWRRYLALKKGYQEYEAKRTTGVPDFPFRKNWQELALKRILRMAAEEGYDRVAWISGAQTADRYDLSKQVDKLTIVMSNGNYKVSTGEAFVGEFTAEKLPEVIGKDLAKKAIDDLNDKNPAKSYSGVDLKIGGEWATNLYDKMVPSFLNKYAKKWGAQVEPFDLNPNLRSGSKEVGQVAEQLSIPITEAMKQSVLTEGQPMFQREARGAPTGKQSQDQQGTAAVGKLQKALGKVASEKVESSDLRMVAIPSTDEFAAASMAAEALGARLVTIEISDGLKAKMGTGIAGLFDPAQPDAVFLNKDTRRPIMETAAHELLHRLKTKHPDLYRQFVEIAREQGTIAYRQAVAQRTEEEGRGRAIGEEEVLADISGDLMAKKGFWQKVYEKSPEAAKAALKELIAIIEKIRGALKGESKYQSYFKDLTKVRDILAGVMAEYKARENVAPTSEERGPLFAKEAKDQTRTPEFKAWFGDWENDPESASKVVDEGGMPLVVYLGHSNSTLYGTKYNPRRSVAGGFYATESPEIASNYVFGKLAGVNSDESYGDQYRFQRKNGAWTKKLYQVELTPEQMKILETIVDEKDQYGDNKWDFNEMDRWVEQNAPYDKDAKRIKLTGSWHRPGSALRNIHDFYEYMGYNIAYPNDQAGQTYFERQVTNRFEDLLNRLGIDWQSYDWSNPGVMPIYLNIRNPLDAARPFPAALLKDLERVAARERPIEGESASQWTKHLPMREWLDGIKSGDEFWTTQIPTKAIPIIKKHGYDGIKELGLKGETDRAKRQINWIALEPTQIKSATGNRGTFDPENPDIRFSREKASDTSPYTTGVPFKDPKGGETWEDYAKRMGVDLLRTGIDSDLYRELRDVYDGDPTLTPKQIMAKYRRAGGPTGQKMERRTPKTLEKRGFVGGEDRTYQRISHEESIARAEAIITEKGEDGAMAWILTEDRPSSTHTATALELMKRYQGEADRLKETDPVKAEIKMAHAVEIATTLAERLTAMGEAIEAVRLIAKLSPDAIAMTARQVIDKANAQRPAKAKKVELSTEEATKLRELAKKAQQWDVLTEETKALAVAAERFRERKQTAEDVQTVKRFTSKLGEVMGPKPEKGSGRVESVARILSTKLDGAARKAAERLRARGKEVKLYAGIPIDEVLQDVADYAIIGAAKLAKSGIKYAQWADQMVEDFGEPIRPALKKIWPKALQVLQDEKARARKLHEQASAMRAILAKIEGTPEIAESPDVDALVKLVDTVKSTTGAAQLEAAQELQIVLQAFQHISLGRKIKTVRNIAMLLNPKTVVTRNPVGNEGFHWMERIAIFPASAIDWTASKVTGKDRTITWKTEGQNGFWEGFFKGARAGWKGVNPEGIQSKYDIQAGLTFKGKGVLGKLEQTLGASLKSFDYAAYTRAKNQCLGSLAALDADRKGLKGEERKRHVRQLIENADEAALEIAHQKGLYEIFQDENRVTQFFTGARKLFNIIGMKDFGLGDIVIPFAQVPGNIIARGIDYSPIGVARGIGILLDPYTRGAKQRDVIMAISRGITGTGLTGLGIYLANAGALVAKGVLTGKPPEDYDLRRFMEEHGRPGYSINTSAIGRFAKALLGGSDWKSALKTQNGDTYVSYDWAQPAAINLAVVANVAQNLDEKANALRGLSMTVLDAVDAGVNTLIDQPLLQGLKKVIGSEYGDKSTIEKLVGAMEDLPASFVPSFVGNVARLTDPIARERYDPSQLRRVLNKVVARLPIVSKKLPEVHRILGEGSKKTIESEGAWRLWDLFINPAIVTKYNMDEVAQIVMEPYEEQRLVRQMPRVAPKKITVPKSWIKTRLGKQTRVPVTIDLTGEQVQLLQKLMAENTQKMLSKGRYKLGRKEVSLAALSKMSPMDQEQALANTVSDAKQKAVETLLGQRPELRQQIIQYVNRTKERTDQVAATEE